MEMKRILYVAKCPTKKCKSLIRLSEGRYAGGANDKGGVIIECDLCKKPFPCRLANAQDTAPVSRVTQGGKVIDTWADDLPESIEQKYKLGKGALDKVQRIIVEGYEKPPKTNWSPTVNQPTFEADGINFEETAAIALQKYRNEINKQYKAYWNWYVKGNSADKSFIIINYEYNSKDYQAVFAKQLDTENDLNTDNLYLIYHSEVDLQERIDGIYTRDEILLFLERLLNRWRYTANEILLVVPFIGFSYKGSEEGVQELWEWLLLHADSSKSKLITRRATVNLFKNAEVKAGVPFDELIEWGLIEPLVSAVSKRGATFERSHAKYYVGVFDKHVEVLTGSFNIHKGGSFENVSFRKYDKDFFKQRYLHMFSDSNYSTISSREQVHYMVLGKGSQENNITGLEELLKKINQA